MSRRWSPVGDFRINSNLIISNHFESAMRISVESVMPTRALVKLYSRDRDVALTRLPFV